MSSEVDNLITMARSRGHKIWEAGPATPDAVRRIEEAIGTSLPPSYVSFLLSHGSMLIRNKVVSGVIEGNRIRDGHGTVLGGTESLRADGGLPAGFLVVGTHESRAFFCLDLNRRRSDGEFPVVRFEMGSLQLERPEADTFEEWLVEFCLRTPSGVDPDQIDDYEAALAHLIDCVEGAVRHFPGPEPPTEELATREEDVAELQAVGAASHFMSHELSGSPETSDCLTTETLYVQRSHIPSPHFLGGPSLHSGTECPECGREVTLTWDLDLSAPEIPAPIKHGFSRLQRLPLYVCSQCSVLSYRVVDDEHITCFPHDRYLEWCYRDESPHYEARAEIERQPIHLHRIPPAIDALWRKDRGLRYYESLAPDEAKTLQVYYESLKIDPVNPHYYSQLGGSPYWIQSPRVMACPNELCVACRKSAYQSDLPAMKRLAHISPPDSPGLGDSLGYFDFQFLICPECCSIRVQYECT